MVGYCGAQTLNTTKTKQLCKFQEEQSSHVCTSCENVKPLVAFFVSTTCVPADKKILINVFALCPHWKTSPKAATFPERKTWQNERSHPGHHLFNLLPSGRFYRSLKTGSTVSSPKTIHTLRQLKHAK